MVLADTRRRAAAWLVRSQGRDRGMGSPPSAGSGRGKRGALNGGDGGDRVERAAGAPTQRAAPVGRALVLEPPLPAPGGRVLQPGQLKGQTGGQGDLDQAARAVPAGVVVLVDAADQIVGPAPVVAGVLTPTAIALQG